MRRAAWVAAAGLVLALSPADRWLDATMPRLVLLAIPAWIALGFLAVGPTGWAARRAWERANPRGRAGLAWALGALGFWMIPRSVDAIAASDLADQLMHASLFGAGAALAASWRLLPFVVRGALGIYGAAMTIALGFVYSSYSALLCGTFNLAQQRLTGLWLLRVAPVVVLLVVAAGARSLHSAARRRARGRTSSPIAGLAAVPTSRLPAEQEAPS